MKFEEILELTKGKLNELTAKHVMEWELLVVGYIGSDSETARQKELELWLENLEIHTVGKYYIIEEDSFYRHEYSWHPSENFQDAWEVFQKMRRKLFSKRKSFMDVLQKFVHEEVGTPVAYPDVFWFMTPDKICRAALHVEIGSEE